MRLRARVAGSTSVIGTKSDRGFSFRRARGERRLFKEHKLYQKEEEDLKRKLDKFVADNAEEWDIKNTVRLRSLFDPCLCPIPFPWPPRLRLRLLLYLFLFPRVPLLPICLLFPPHVVLSPVRSASACRA